MDGAKGQAAATMATLVFLRHGQSLFNQEGRFTGWMDIDLSQKGRAEAAEAGRLLKRSGLDFDIAFTSVLKRAIRTAWIVLDEMDRMWIPLLPCWRLNERSYGALEGEKKSEMDEKYGPGQVHLWRRGFSERPPALSGDDRRFPGRDERYRDIEESLLPRTESLQDAMQRVMPLWIEQIFPSWRGAGTCWWYPTATPSDLWSSTLRISPIRILKRLRFPPPVLCFMRWMIGRCFSIGGIWQARQLERRKNKMRC